MLKFFKKKPLKQNLEIGKVEVLPKSVEKKFVLLAYTNETSNNKYGGHCEFVLCKTHDLETPLYDILILTGKNSKKVYKNINEKMFIKDFSGEYLTLILDDIKIEYLEDLCLKNKNMNFYGCCPVQRIGEDPQFCKCAPYEKWVTFGDEEIDVKDLELLSCKINEEKDKLNITDKEPTA